MKSADQIVKSLLENEQISDGWMAQVTVANRGGPEHQQRLNAYLEILKQLAVKHGVTYSDCTSGGGTLDMNYECPSGDVGQAFIDEAAKAGKRRFAGVFIDTYLDDGVIPDGA